MQDKTIKPATQEEVAQQKSTKQTPEEKEKMDNLEELKVKRAQLKNDLTFINGGDVRVGQMVNHMSPIEDGMRVTKRNIEKMQITLEGIKAINPKFEFEENPKYQEICAEEIKEQRDDMKRKLKQQEDAMIEVLKRIPESKKRINELEKLLGKKLTNFEKKEDDE